MKPYFLIVFHSLKVAVLSAAAAASLALQSGREVEQISAAAVWSNSVLHCAGCCWAVLCLAVL